MVDRQESTRKEASPSRERQEIPVVHEVGEPNAGSNGQGSSFQAPRYFGGGSVFQSMVGYAPGNPVYSPGTVFGGAQSFMRNPMYGNIGMQPGFQKVQGSYGMPQGTFSAAGYQNQQVSVMSASLVVSGPAVSVPPVSVPMLQAPPMDPVMAYEKLKPYKEGGAALQFDTFRGFEDRTKALSFLQQFDAAYVGGNFTESSKLKGNASQWWSTMLMQGQAPAT